MTPARPPAPTAPPVPPAPTAPPVPAAARPAVDDPERRAFRQAAGSFATGVTVVTTWTADGPWGTTVGSFVSVSLDPLLVMVSLRRDSRLRAAVGASGVFAASVLAAGQEATARHFADSARRPGWAGFEGVATAPGPADGCPVLTGARAVFDCRVAAVHPAGDHDLVVGEVLGFTRQDTDGALLFLDGQYGQYGRHRTSTRPALPNPEPRR